MEIKIKMKFKQFIKIAQRLTISECKQKMAQLLARLRERETERETETEREKFETC